MADADLFMECEEEELEPWQQMNDDVEDEEVSIVESKDSTGTYCLATAPPAVSSGTLSSSIATQITTSSGTPSSDTKTVPMIAPVSSVLPPTVVQAAVPSLMSPGLAKTAPPQQLILTQSPGGLGTVAMSQVLQPVQVMPSPGSGAGPANNQPIFITTQGFPLRSTRPIQNTVNPSLGIVLNVQPGQTVRPITLVSAPGAQFFKPAMSVQQVVTQPPHVRPGAPTAIRPPTSTYTTVQIPATLTIRSSTPLSQQGVTTFANMAASTVTQPIHSSVLANPPQAKPGFQALTVGGNRRIVMQGGRVFETQEDRENLCKLTPEKPGEPEVQKLGSVVNLVTSPSAGKPQSLQIVVNKASSNGLGGAAHAVTSKSPLDNIKVGPATSVSATKVCPRCGAEFRMIEALRGHMCFCCPQLTQDLPDTKIPQSTSLSGGTVTHPPLSLPLQPKPVPPSGHLAEGPSSGSDPDGKLIMLVDDFYYGSHEGNCGQAPRDAPREPMLFKCLSCSKKLKNNIRLMNHMKHHVELEQQSGEVDTHTYCQHCYRQFPTPFQLQCHLESVHSHYESSTKCKICEWAFESEPVFLQHMKNTHKPGEMPYVCQVCDYRSSFYLDVCNHFRTWHEDTRHLLCLYCLKVFKNSNSFQQHFFRHQKKSVYHCNKCRLQFLFTKDKIEHKLNHHKTFRKPRQLEGLQPGTKVTIRAYAVHNRGMSLVPIMPPGAHNLPGRETPSPHVGEATHLQAQKGNRPNQQQPPFKKKSVSKMLELLTKFQEEREMLGKQTCLECNFDVPDFPNHYPTYVHCSLCRYSTCCSRAYANHMINNHIPRKSTKYLALYRKPVPSWMKLTCVSCKYTTQVGDLMAKHLAQNPSHCYSLCTLKECLESDIECSEVEEEEEEEEPEREAGIEGGKLHWASVDCWGKPEQSTMVQEFTASCGPQHSLMKNADAIDYFYLLFPRRLIQVLAQETNAFAAYSQEMGQGDLDWSPVTVEEILGFLGLSVLMGLQNLPEVHMYWSSQHYDNCDTFLRTMAQKRFQQIAIHIRGGGYATDQQQYPDKLRVIRPMLTMMNSTMWKTYEPNNCLTIDRALLPSLEAEGGKEKQSTYMPQVWLLCDSKSGYCHRLIIQTEPGGGKNNRERGFKVALPLVEGLQGKHHQVFLANSLVSVPLVMELLARDIYCSSSFPPQVSIFPENIWEQWEQDLLSEPGDFLQYQCGPLLATRWKDSKEMWCLSTNAQPGLPDTVWRKSHMKAGELYPIKRPQAFQLLQENMRGVDICNQLQACNPMGGLSRDTRWRCLFWYLLNLTVVNSFIILRETRKDSPPPWVEEGRFSQVSYRKRLGLQLAKCAQRGTQRHSGEERYEVATAPIEKAGEAGGARKMDLRLRHRLVKISTKPKRCKNCSLRNLRHASVFGCVICRVNLCKGSRCFWEYHDLSPHNKGSPKVGFVMENQRDKLPQNDNGSSCKPSMTLPVAMMHADNTHQSNLTATGKELVQEMAPVEDKGLEKEEEPEALPEKVQEDTNVKEVSNSMGPKMVSSLPSIATGQPVADTTGAVKEREETLSVRQLRIVLFALCCGIPQAAEHFNTQPQLIEAWLLEKEKQVHREGRASAGISGEAVDLLVEWVLAQREQQLPVNEKNLFQKASEIHSHANQSSSFRISYEWAVGFMLQHDLGLQATDTVRRRLPLAAEENAQAFTEFVHKQIQIQSFSPSVICAMDELSVFVDLDVLTNPLSSGKEFAFQLVGVGESLCDIFLALLADGTMLPTMVFFKGQLPGRLRAGLPESVLLEAKMEGFTEDEELELWISQVWQKHVNSQGGSKAMLILDPFRSHMLEDSLGAVSAINTLPTIIPMGCTCRLQPLEMCLRPVLQHFLQSRWTQLAAQGGAVGASPKDLVQFLVAWLMEALASLAAHPKLLQRSFHVAHVYPGVEAEQSPINAQRELILKLTEVLLGPEAPGPKPAAPKETVGKQGEDKDQVNDKKVVGDQGCIDMEKEPKDEKKEMIKLKNPEVSSEKKNILDKSEVLTMSPSHISTANPQVLHQIFDKDSDAESFHGFDDNEIYTELNS